MKVLARITDPIPPQHHRYHRWQHWVLSLIRDPRDLPFVSLSLHLTLVFLPLAWLLYLTAIGGWLWWSLAFGYSAYNLYQKGPFILMLHCSSHRKLYKRRYDLANLYIPWILGPFFGQTPETYFSHHIGMHHVENNLADDLSSTMGYQRDSFRHFLRYLGTFFFAVIGQLVGYFTRKNRKKFLRKMLGGELSYYLLCGLLCLVNWQATLVVFLLPLLLSRVLMMIGNWSQHAFIDAADPANLYKNSITCINTPYNKQCFNDGYHIGHHLKPNLHWTEHPGYFLGDQAQYIKHRAIVFDGLDYFEIFLLLMLKRYDRLASHLVNLEQSEVSQQEVVRLLQERTRCIPWPIPA